jgi:hypothetical protein
LQPRHQQRLATGAQVGAQVNRQADQDHGHADQGKPVVANQKKALTNVIEHGHHPHAQLVQRKHGSVDGSFQRVSPG